MFLPWNAGGICAIELVRTGRATNAVPALDINASAERICAMPFGYHVGESIPVFNTDLREIAGGAV